MTDLAGRPPADLPGADLFFRRVVEGMRCGILTVDGEGRVITVNRLAREILEIGDEAEPASPVQDVLAHHPRLAQVLLDALEMDLLPNRAEMELRSREDDGRTIGFTISPIRGDDGRPAGIALFFKDLTQVERREEQERLRDRLAALGQMAASMAHEIRNPLASIDVTATLLKRRVRDQAPEIRRAVEKILAEVERLNGTITQGLEFARSISLERTPQRLETILDMAVEEASSRFSEGPLEVEREVAAGTPAVSVDANHLRLVFVNLLVNAFEAMEGRGRVRVALAPVARPGRSPATVEVVIEDDGPGIPKEVREKLFHPFVTTKTNGSGIGLAMARKIVECHHGLIDVKSEAGKGTAFRIRLPVDVESKVGE
jgi:PAS domain S-box-containing protein